MTFRAVARRESDWWVVEVDGVGATQGRSLASARRMAEDLVSGATGDAVDGFDLDLTLDLPDGLTERLARVRADRVRLDAEQRELAARSAMLLAGLRDIGMTGPDIAVALGVTKQRVSQMLKAAAEK